MDEPHHIARGLTYFVRGPVVWNGNPPLAHALMALPLWFDPTLIPPESDLRNINDFRLLGQAFLTTVQPRWPAAFFAARLPSMWLMMMTLGLIYVWTRGLFGQRAGWLVLLFAAFDPNLIANAQLATTDLAVTAFSVGAGYAAWRLGRTGRWRDALAFGLWAGLALTSKFTAFVIIGGLGLMLLFNNQLPITLRLQRLVGAAVMSLWVIWGIYFFHIGTAKGVPFPIPAPDFVGEFLWQATANGQNRPSFLAGVLHPSGVPEYFPLAILLKTPSAVMIAFLLAVALSVYRKAWAQVLLPMGVVMSYLAVLIASPLNIGYRHLLPMLPFAYVMLGALVARPLPVWGKRGVGVLAIWTVITSVSVFPYDLAYFAEWSGGPAKGYQWLSDSSLDWGQDREALRAYVQNSPVPVDAAYFGPLAFAWPSTLPTWEKDGTFHPANPAPQRYAISATYLQGVVYRNPDALDFFRRLTPVDQIGYSILVYDVQPTVAHWAAVCNTPAFSPDEATLEKWLGVVQRVVRFNCETSWVRPPGPGWYVLPDVEIAPFGDAEAMPTRTVYREAHVVRVEAIGETGPSFAEARAHFNNALTLLAARQIATDTVTTMWRVTAPLAPPLSLMAHRLAADGVFLDSADGLGIPEIELQPGDVFFQRHHFNEILGADDGLAVGVYNWQTGARWLTADGADVVLLDLADLR